MSRDAKDCQGGPEAASTPRVPVVVARKVVYVVDDDDGMLKGLERLLKAHGFDVEVFCSAEDFHAHARPRDALCLVLDIHLNGMSGIELRRELGRSGFSAPVIFVTGDNREVTHKAALDAGCVAYLMKPFPGKLLVDAIERALERQPG